MYKEILINVEPQEKRVAILENRALEEYYVERATEKLVVGNIYKGKVTSIVPGIEAAFIDLGLEKNGFLYVSDIIGPLADYEELIPSEVGGASKRKAEPAERNIQDLLKKGQEVLVQVVKEPLGTKGVRLTTHVSLPGRYLVLMPTEKHFGISKKIQDVKERDRIRSILKGLSIPSGMGIIVRTAAAGKTKRELARDVRYLIGLWRKIRATAYRRSVPSLIHEEFNLGFRVIRDYLAEDVNRIVVDSREEYKRLARFMRIILPQLKPRLELYGADLPLFEKRGVETEIEKVYERRIDLKSGGYLLIEPTESLVTIDVNTGKYVGKKSLEETVVQVNLEAAKEIARQIRLRDLGGIIIIDFIDMASFANRQKVLKALEEALKRDRAKTNVMPLSELGLVEMTRQRVRRSLESVAYQTCPYCEGRGSIKSAITVSINVLRQIKKFFKETGKRSVEVFVHPDIASRLFNEDRGSIASLERRFRAKVTIRPDSTLHAEEVKLREPRK